MSQDLSRRRILQLAIAPALLAGARGQAQDLSPTASRVFPGTDGKLVYVPDAQGNTLLDSSHAGYGGGGVPLPAVAVKETLWPVAGDNTEAIQAAIDKVSSLPLDGNGIRGAVLLRAGYYRMATPLRIQASGVVLRGEGMGDTGTVLVGTGTGRAPAPAGAPPGGGGPGGGGSRR
jgi:pectin methylesterase-like acyl-CoA thioesterase